MAMMEYESETHGACSATGMKFKEFGALERQDGCLSQANFIIIAMQASSFSSACPATGILFKEFGSLERQDDCLSQANFITIAMERRKRGKSIEEILYEVASRISKLVTPSPTSASKDRVSTSSVINNTSMDSRDEEITFRCADLGMMDIELKNFGTNSGSHDSFRSLQSFYEFSEVLKNEALRRHECNRHNHPLTRMERRLLTIIQYLSRKQKSYRAHQIYNSML